MRKIPEGTTLYIRQKVCLQCWRTNVGNAGRCAHCSHIFLAEATPEEEEILREQINERKEAKNNED